jgi:hypothetical protein
MKTSVTLNIIARMRVNGCATLQDQKRSHRAGKAESLSRVLHRIAESFPEYHERCEPHINKVCMCFPENFKVHMETRHAAS